MRISSLRLNIAAVSLSILSLVAIQKPAQAIFDAPDQQPAQAVPEPTSMVGLLAVGALGVGALRKRQKQG